MSGGAPRSVIFVGDLTVDLLVDDEPVPALTDAVRSFSRTAMSAEDWAAYVSTATLGRRIEAQAGGSIANVAAAFAANASGARMHFICVEQSLTARVRPPFWWPGYNRSAADLRARSITVLGYDVAPRTSETPGALAFVDPLGNVTRLIINDHAVRVAIEEPGELLVIRSDHCRLLRREYVERFIDVAVLLADDGLGWDEVPELLSNAKRGWVFGTVQQVQAAASSSFRQRLLERVWLVGTDGPRPCVVLSGRSGERSLLKVPALPYIVSDLGAGDAYMGGFLALAFGGGSLHDAHRSGCAAAATALSHRGARAELTDDLNKVFPDIGRVSPCGDEGRVFHHIRCSPGLTVVSGGQTGVDSVSIREAVRFGLPVHAIMPKGMRQENGRLTARQAARLGCFRVHELGSESFRYRTWVTVYAADAVILFDHAGGEGSEETRRAADCLNRPVLDAGRMPLASTTVAHWLESKGARVVLVAGSRTSLLARSGTRRILQRQMRNVMRGLCLVNRRLLAGGSEILLPPQPVRLGVPGCLLDGGVIDLLLPDLALTERVALPARGLATAFKLRELTAVITWPSLLAKHEIGNARVVPLGAFPVHYGFLSSAERPRPGDRLAIQYAEALADNAPNGEFAWRSSFTITGQAEAWLRHGLADVAYDTLRTGTTKEQFGLGGFFPSHWESISLVWR